MLVFSGNCLSQWNNLVPNYSFETTDITGWQNSGLLHIGLPYDQISYCSTCPYADSSNEKQIEHYWSYVENWTVPLKKFWCVYDPPDPIPTPDLTYAPSWNTGVSDAAFPRDYSGDLWPYTGLGEGEFLIVQLDPAIENGKYYYIEAFVNKYGDSSPYGTIELFNERPKVCGYNQYITEYNTNSDFQTILAIQYPGFSPDTYGWTRYRGFFQAEEDKNWLSIGSKKGMHWDDIKIYEVSSNLCKDEWYFDNTVFNYPLEIFQAGDFIKAGTGVDPEAGQLDGPVTVLNGSHTVFRAGNYILLEPGFSVEPNAEFETFIEPCENLLPPVNLPNQVHNCISTSLELGFPGYEGTFIQMQWSPSTYLDDPTSATPTFTPPGSNGSITYTVVYTTGAFPGVQITQVTVNYSDGSNTPPSISYSNLNFDNYNLSVDLNINDYVDVITMSFSGQSYNFYRDVDFNAPVFHLDLNHLQVSCCEDVTISFEAKSYCGGTSSTSFDWVKTGPPFGFGLFNSYVIYPGSTDPQEPHALCVETYLACSYDLQVTNRFGNIVYASYSVAIVETQHVFFMVRLIVGMI